MLESGYFGDYKSSENPLEKPQDVRGKKVSQVAQKASEVPAGQGQVPVVSSIAGTRSGGKGRVASGGWAGAVQAKAPLSPLQFGQHVNLTRGRVSPGRLIQPPAVLQQGCLIHNRYKSQPKNKNKDSCKP